jgi:hypothetical protein
VSAVTDVLILKYVRQKNGEKMSLFSQTTACFCKELIITSAFDKTAIFVAKIGENR